MGAGIRASQVAGGALVLWLCGVLAASAEASALAEPQEVFVGARSDAKAVSEDQVAA